jgi:hypothetical protein
MGRVASQVSLLGGVKQRATAFKQAVKGASNPFDHWVLGERFGCGTSTW